MTENMIYAAFFFPAAAAVVIFFMKYWAAVLQARARLRQDEAYREVAARAAGAQAEIAAALADMQSRLAGIEKILKDVG
ncbi:MAG TPA: hypothetical protein VMB71_09170 [Acetobacteraceae bacterium]|nr:hypothetical protein [Acetobacteraceae bacterium]